MSRSQQRYVWPVLVWRADGTPRQIVVQDFEIEVDGLHLRVPAGWDDFDGASIPRWLWNSVGHPFTREFQRAALVHDYLYGVPAARTRPEIDNRAKADALFYRMLLLDGVERSKAKRMHWAVDQFGEDRYRQPGIIAAALAQLEAFELERRDRQRAEAEAKAILLAKSGADAGPGPQHDPELMQSLAQIDWDLIRSQF